MCRYRDCRDKNSPSRFWSCLWGKGGGRRLRELLIIVNGQRDCKTYESTILLSISPAGQASSSRLRAIPSTVKLARSSTFKPIQISPPCSTIASSAAMLISSWIGRSLSRRRRGSLACNRQCWGQFYLNHSALY